MMAGRNLSADIYAQSGARLVMGCFTMGEAAGTAMSICLKKNITPRMVDRIELQKELIANNVNIGQNMRKIPGIDLDEITFEDKYKNPELRSTVHKPKIDKTVLKFIKGNQ